MIWTPKKRLVCWTPRNIQIHTSNSVESTDNGVFDCRVLSRRHASLWTEGSRCFVRDLGSSNGTFVNGERVDRLQSEGVELFSGDYLQFGEDVDDNYCVRATVRLLPEENAEGEGENRPETPLITISGMQLNDHSYFFFLPFSFIRFVHVIKGEDDTQIDLQEVLTVDQLRVRVPNEVSVDGHEAWQDVTPDQVGA